MLVRHILFATCLKVVGDNTNNGKKNHKMKEVVALFCQ
jgi:hypothetical protein